MSRIGKFVGRMLLASPALASAAMGQAAEPDPQAEPPARPITAALRVRGDLGLNTGFDDAPGDVTVSRAGAGFDLGLPVGQRGNVALGLDYEFSSYDFDGATGFASGVASPWDDVHTQTLTATYSRQHDQRLAWFVGAGAAAAGEAGADFGDSITWGGFGGARYAVSEDVSLGFGLGVRTRLEQSALLIPLPLLEWRFDPRWLLSVGDGIPGASLSYSPSDRLTLALSGAWEYREFRLDEDGPVPGGVGTDRRIGLGLSATLRPRERISIRVGGGIHVGQSFELRDGAGAKLADINADPSPFIGGQLTFRF